VEKRESQLMKKAGFSSTEHGGRETTGIIDKLPEGEQ
jgi:hypothetical protein